MQKLFVKFQVLWKDSKRFRYGLIAALIVLLLIVSTIFASSVSAESVVVNSSYYMGILTDYGGSVYPQPISNGISLSSGSLYLFQNVTYAGSSSTATNKPYTHFYFDFSSLDFSYQYNIVILGSSFGAGSSGKSFSFDGFLTSTSFSSGTQISMNYSYTYSSVTVYDDHVSYKRSANSNTGSPYQHTFVLNDLVDSSSHLVITLRNGNTVTTNFPFGIIIYRELTPLESVMDSIGSYSGGSQGYLDIVSDIADGYSSGDFDSDTASFLLDYASSQSSAVGYSYVNALKSQADSLYYAYQVALAGCTTEAEAQAVAQQYQQDLADAYNDAVPTLSSSEDIQAVYTIYKLTSDLAEEDYLQFALDLFNTRNTDLNNQHAGVTDIQQEFLDEIDLVSFDSLVDFDGWMSEISNESRVNFVNLANQFFLSSWKWFFIVPMILNLIALLLGTAAMKFGRSSE